MLAPVPGAEISKKIRSRCTELPGELVESAGSASKPCHSACHA